MYLFSCFVLFGLRRISICSAPNPFFLVKASVSRDGDSLCSHRAILMNSNVSSETGLNQISISLQLLSFSQCDIIYQTKWRQKLHRKFLSYCSNKKIKRHTDAAVKRVLNVFHMHLHLKSRVNPATHPYE